MNALTKWLEERRMADAELAERMGVARATVGRWKRGESRPQPKKMDALTLLTGGAVTASDFQGIASCPDDDRPTNRGEAA